MALLGFWGFDDSAAEVGTTQNGYGTPGRTGVGGYCQGDFSALTPAPVPQGTKMYVGAGMYATGNPEQLQLREGGTVHVAARINLDVMNYITIQAHGADVITGPKTIVPNTWVFVEISAVIDDVNGSVEVRVNGQSYLTYNGDTRNGGTGNVDRLYGSSGYYQARFDDAYFCDATGTTFNNFLGDVCVKPVLPNGNGNASQFTNDAGNSTNNYSHVDKAVSNSTTYVGAGAAALTDHYTIAGIPATDTPLAIQNLVYAAKTDAGTPPLLHPESVGAFGGIRTDSGIALSTTYALYPGAIYTTDPDGNALTAAAVNAMEIGMSTT